jgi:hypothetical protein
MYLDGDLDVSFLPVVLHPLDLPMFSNILIVWSLGLI